jgi:8-oxo-dGTP pyrophosphatase MutT (NUDIX family)
MKKSTHHDTNNTNNTNNNLPDSSGNSDVVTRQLFDPNTRKFSSVVIGCKENQVKSTHGTDYNRLIVAEVTPRVVPKSETNTTNTTGTTNMLPTSPSSESINSKSDTTTSITKTKTPPPQYTNSTKTGGTTTSSKTSQSNFCNNCGRVGHIFQQCKQPITSIGIIAFRYNKNKIVKSDDLDVGNNHQKVDNNFEYLMINRTHSLGYVEFMRGKYPVYNFDYLINIFNEMTIQEKTKIKNSSFTQLWKDLWGEFIGQQYRNEEKTSREKFNILKMGVDMGGSKEKYSLDELIRRSNEHVQWSDTEWGFPKGRRNFQEKDLACAYREFEEETGYTKKHLHLIQNVMPFEEIFTGSNMKSYKHKYFLAYMEPESLSCSFPSEFHSSEVGEMKWLTYEECVANMRPYNIEKIDILRKINELLHNFSIHYAIQ